MGETEQIGVAAPPLGPGESDPRSPTTEVAAAAGPLGPGDDDPRSPVKGDALPVTKPLGPGDSIEPHDGRIMLAPAPAGPGGTDTGPRHLTHVMPARVVDSKPEHPR
jgi:hypothetical protein